VWHALNKHLYIFQNAFQLPLTPGQLKLLDMAQHVCTYELIFSWHNLPKKLYKPLRVQLYESDSNNVILQWLMWLMMIMAVVTTSVIVAQCQRCKIVASCVCLINTQISLLITKLWRQRECEWMLQTSWHHWTLYQVNDRVGLIDSKEHLKD
jgi:hypothetical protein